MQGEMATQLFSKQNGQARSATYVVRKNSQLACEQTIII
jgi:hypothetical protein